MGEIEAAGGILRGRWSSAYGENGRRIIKKRGEPGLVRFLASRDAIPAQSIDPTEAQEVEALRTRFTPEQIKMFFILRQMTEYGRMLEPKQSLEEYLQNTIEFFTRVPGLDVPPRSMKELEPSFRAKFSRLGSYKDANPDWFDPVQTKTIFNKISRASSDFRDRHMVTLLSNAVCEQKRVFAVVGASHVVMQEQAIRRLVTEKCSRDIPQEKISVEEYSKADGPL